METFYLHTIDGRYMIDKEFHVKADQVHDSCHQPSWIAAKKWFGFELTVTQEQLLAKQNDPAR